MNSSLICTVIVCTHNPRLPVLELVLNALKCQTLPHEKWELIIIDNDSDPSVASSINVSWHPNGHIIEEHRLGQTNARIKGIELAQAKTLIFVDDDNVLAKNYLKSGCDLLDSFPQLGVIGGQMLPVYEMEPETRLLPYMNFLAIRKLEKDFWGNQKDFARFPCGSGMIVRKDVAKEWYMKSIDDPLKQFLGRKGTALDCGDDYDICLTAIEMNYGTGLFKSLQLDHHIAAKRVSIDYLLRLRESIAFSETMLLFTRNPDGKFLHKSFANRAFEFYWFLRQSPIERAFLKARDKGISRARNTIQTIMQSP